MDLASEKADDVRAPAGARPVGDWLTFGAIAVAYLLLGGILLDSPYGLLNNELRPHVRTFFSAWPDLLGRVLNPFDDSIVVYRPLPEITEWLLSVIFRSQPGAWHLVNLGVRLVSVYLMWQLLQRIGVRTSARCLGTLFFALFPAFPEANLIYAEVIVTPLLVLAIRGLYVLSHSPVTAGRAVGLALAVIGLTLCKETLTPVSMILLLSLAVFIVPMRSLTPKLFLIVVIVAVAIQAHRAFQMAVAPYAAGGAPRSFEIITQMAKWVVVNSFLWNSSLRPVAVLLAAVAIVGCLRLTTDALNEGVRRSIFRIALVLILVSTFAVIVVSPYRALRYLSAFSVPLALIIAIGSDWTSARFVRGGPALAAVVACSVVFFCIPVLAAQAVAVNASSVADWQLLSYVAREHARGRDVALVGFQRDDERLLWIRTELSGMNLTGAPATRTKGRFITVGDATVQLPSRADLGLVWHLDTPSARGRLVSAAHYSGTTDWRNSLRSPVVLTDAAGNCAAYGLRDDRLFEAGDSSLFVPLREFQRLASTLNPSFALESGAGLPPFPGVAWQTCTTSAH